MIEVFRIDKMNKLRSSLLLVTLSFLCCEMAAQVKVSDAVQMDRTVYDFGDIMLSDGPQTCVFTMKNTGSKPVAIYNVISSCGCTGVKWTREPVKPGAEGTVTATYNNDEGPYPFDKTLTMYVSDLSKPVILRIRGVSHERKMSLNELYPVRFGALGIRTLDVKAGNMEQGMQKSDEFTVANLSSKPLKIDFTDVSPCLSIKCTASVIEPGATAKVRYTVKADRKLWGKNYYYATPVVDGHRYQASGTLDGLVSPGGKGVIGIWAITKENFSNLSREEKDRGSRPVFDNSTFSFGRIKAGKQVDAVFTMTNEGKSVLEIYKTDPDFKGAELVGKIPPVAPGSRTEVRIHLDTSAMPKGEALVIVQLITNSPIRPLVDLFITGWIE